MNSLNLVKLRALCLWAPVDIVVFMEVQQYSLRNVPDSHTPAL